MRTRIVGATAGVATVAFPNPVIDPMEHPDRRTPAQVYLVFINDDGVAYNWRWDRADPDEPSLPVGYQTRFRKRLL